MLVVVEDDGNGCLLIYYLKKKLVVNFDKIMVKFIIIEVKRWDDKDYKWNDFKVDIRDDF